MVSVFATSTVVVLVDTVISGQTKDEKKMSKNNGMHNKEVSQRVSEQKKRPIILNGIRYDDQVDAAEKLGVRTNTILTWLREAHDGHGNPCRYEDEEQRPYKFTGKVTNSKRVIVNGVVFDSVRDAAKTIGCWPETVINCIKHDRLCKGYKCRYDNQQRSQTNSDNSSLERSETREERTETNNLPHERPAP